MKKYAGFSFRQVGATDNRYKSDHNWTEVGLYQVDTRFVIPPHLYTTWDAALSTAVGNAIGAFPTYYADGSHSDIRFVNEYPADPCSIGTLLTPRKLRLIFSTGNSMSVAVGAGGIGILTAFSALKSALETSTVKIVCAHLIGEKFKTLNDIAQLAFNPAQAIGTAGSGRYYKGTLTEYISDPTGAVEKLPMKILCNLGDPPGSEPPLAFQGDVESCWGALANSANSMTCPGRSQLIETRKLIATYQIVTQSANGAAVFETRSLPVKKTGQDLLTCMQHFKDKPYMFCLAYQGENRRNIHSLVTLG